MQIETLLAPAVTALGVLGAAIIAAHAAKDARRYNALQRSLKKIRKKVRAMELKEDSRGG